MITLCHRPMSNLEDRIRCSYGSTAARMCWRSRFDLSTSDLANVVKRSRTVNPQPATRAAKTKCIGCVVRDGVFLARTHPHRPEAKTFERVSAPAKVRDGCGVDDRCWVRTLYQLSYRPNLSARAGGIRTHDFLLHGNQSSSTRQRDLATVPTHARFSKDLVIGTVRRAAGAVAASHRSDTDDDTRSAYQLSRGSLAKGRAAA